MIKTAQLQESFLRQAVRTQVNVTMFLMNGFQMRGRIADFDDDMVVLMSEAKQQVVYKHAISTITPERAVDLEGED